MIPWTLIEAVPLPGHKSDLRLMQRDGEFSIQIGHEELMNSREHGSEEALAEQALAKIQGFATPRVLIGGLGMGFTLAAALKHSYPEAKVTVAELMQPVIDWHEGPLGPLAGQPLKDPRVSVKTQDVTRLIKAGQQVWEAILLDVDNGPSPMTKASNRWLYTLDGLKVIFAALVPGGVLGIWSAGPEAGFTQQLERAGFVAEEKAVKSRGTKGSRHIIWLARRPHKGEHVPRSHSRGSSPQRANRQRNSRA